MKKPLSIYIWMFLKYLLLIINFLASIASIFGLVYTIFNDLDNKLSISIWTILILLFIVSIVAMVLLIRNEKQSALNESAKYAVGFHQILHLLRDKNQYLDSLYSRDQKMNKEDFIIKITTDCVEIMNILTDILSEYTGCKVRSCVKLTDFIENNETDPQKINLITFARSGKDGVNASISEHSKKIKVSENTDFEYIFSIKEVYEEHRVHYFYQRNIKKYEKRIRKETHGQERYKNSDKNWKRKYNTTIVLPMRYLRQSTSDEVIYDIIGFLCVDSKTEGAFEKRNFYFTIEFLKGVSDILYSYLNSCITYYKQII